MDIKELLLYAAERSASDLHLSSNIPPLVRIDGDLMPIKDQGKLSSKELLRMIKSVLPRKQMQLSFVNLKRHFEEDFSIDLQDVARCRVNIFQQDEGIGAAFRIIPAKIPSLEELEMPPILKELCELPHGLVLVTGPTGSGKSTTLAAMIDHINHTHKRHILTLEDPIEYVYHSKNCLIQQREIHHHTQSFQNALRAALREDPDVILLGEMRDTETIRMALTAAETGHLVFATLHTNSSAKTINRIIDVFPGDERSLVRSMLAESLQAVVAQVLIKKKAGGRIAAHEVLISTPAVRNLIREDKIPQIDSVIETNKTKGMQTLRGHLQELLAAGKISLDD